MFSKKLYYLLFILFVSILLSACSSYRWVKVVQKAQAKATPTSSNPEVTETTQFKKIIGGMNRIAYKPPDICHSESAGQATGKVSSAREIMSTSCGVWLAELEKAFAKRNYDVVSWKSIDTGYENAKNSGVRILLLINSLEHGISTDRQEIGWNFYESDDIGTQGAPLAINTNWQKSIRSQTPKGAYVPEEYLSAVLDVTAVDLQTNQSIWFFRQALTKKVKDEQQWEGLFYCYKNDQCYKPFVSAATQKDQDADMATKVELIKEKGNPEANHYQQETYQMVKTIVENLVNEFNTGKR